MKRASNTFYKVSIIISIICIVLFAIGLIYISASFSAALAGNLVVRDAKGMAYSKDTIVTALVLYDTIFTVMLALSITNLVISKKARNNPSKKLHIAAIVFGVLSGVEFSAVAGILGLVALSKEPKEAVVDVETKDK